MERRYAQYRDWPAPCPPSPPASRWRGAGAGPTSTPGLRQFDWRPASTYSLTNIYYLNCHSIYFRYTATHLPPPQDVSTVGRGVGDGGGRKLRGLTPPWQPESWEDNTRSGPGHGVGQARAAVSRRKSPRCGRRKAAFHHYQHAASGARAPVPQSSGGRSRAGSITMCAKKGIRPPAAGPKRRSLHVAPAELAAHPRLGVLAPLADLEVLVHMRRRPGCRCI